MDSTAHAVSTDLSLPPEAVSAALGLLDEGATIPFVARYRKEVTGGLDEVQLRDIQERAAYRRELEERRQTVLKSIEEQGKLTEELRARIAQEFHCVELYVTEMTPVMGAHTGPGVLGVVFYADELQ